MHMELGQRSSAVVRSFSRFKCFLFQIQNLFVSNLVMRNGLFITLYFGPEAFETLIMDGVFF